MALLFFPFVLGAAFFGVVFWLRRRQAGRPGDGGQCGQCGYSTRGLTTFACPECGADLREVGIAMPPPAPRAAPLAVALGLFLAVLLGLALMKLGYRAGSAPPPRLAAPPVPVFSAPVMIVPAPTPTTAPASQPAESPEPLPPPR